MGNRVLVTGAAGSVGAVTCAGLRSLGWSVGGFDAAGQATPGDADRAGSATPGDADRAGSATPGDPDWVVGDITDADALRRALRDVDAVVHLAGVATESDFASLNRANMIGAYQVFHAAQESGVPRLLYASSGHAVGHHPRTSLLRTDVRTRPDSLYGLTKVFGEGLGALFADRYGMRVACVRIGSCVPRPTVPRHLATWLSPGDAVRLFAALLSAADLTYEIVYGISGNSRAWWDLEPGRRLGYHPVDNAEVYAAEVLAAAGRSSDDDPESGYAGGFYALERPDRVI